MINANLAPVKKLAPEFGSINNLDLDKLAQEFAQGFAPSSLVPPLTQSTVLLSLTNPGFFAQDSTHSIVLTMEVNRAGIWLKS